MFRSSKKKRSVQRNRVAFAISRMRMDLAVLLMVISPAICYAQTVNPLKISSPFHEQFVLSPEMSAIVQNIVYPVEHSTGLVNITIPLYEIKSGDLTLPISLSYHASGVKLNALSGWVGQGWNLNCEPMISRIVKGEDDSFQQYKCPIDTTKMFDSDYLYQLAQNNEAQQPDEQPDEYYYKLIGKQGLFMYVLKPKESNKEYMTIPYQNILIKPGFYITDDDGTLYKFNGAYEQGGATLSSTIGWKPSSIVASNGKDSISFSYVEMTEQSPVCNDYQTVIDDFSMRYGLFTDRGQFEMGFWEDYNKDDRYALIPLPDYWMKDPVVYSTVCGRKEWTIHTYQRKADGTLYRDWKFPCLSSNRTEVLTRTQKVSEIRFAGGKAIFKLNGDKYTYQKILEEILIKNNKDETVRSIKFNYKYIRGQNRYYLQGLKITGKDTLKAECYAFDYYNMYYLPNVGNKSIDYWGYYNGQLRNDTTTLVPRQAIETVRDSAVFLSNGALAYYTKVREDLVYIGSELSRESDERYMLYGTLKSVRYPAGSRDEFEYEGHRQVDLEGNIRVVGGLRIKKITSYIKDVPKRVRTFRYGYEECGTGYSPISSGLDAFMLEQTKCYFYPTNIYYSSETPIGAIVSETGTIITARCRTYFSNPVIPNTFNGGSSVMYDYVTEYEGTPEHNTGKTIYQYAVNKDTLMAPIRHTCQLNKYDSWQYGHLLVKSVYKNVGGQYKKTEEIKNEFRPDMKNFGTVYIGEACMTGVANVDIDPYNEMKNNVVYFRTKFNIGANLLVKSVHEKFDDTGNSEMLTTNKTYDDLPGYLLCTRQTETDRQGISFQTDFFYPIHYKQIHPYSEMLTRNIVNPVVKSVYVRGNKYLEVEFPYSACHTNIFRPNSMKMKYSNTGNSISRFSFFYDHYGNRQEIRKDDKEKVVCLYGYNHQYIVAKIENATYAEVVSKISGGQNTIDMMASAGDIGPWIDQLDGLRASMPNCHVTTYTYKPLVGVVTETGPTGLTVHYEYDSLGRLAKTYVIHNNRTEVLQQYDYHYKTEGQR